jgi:hypothetical protein
VRGRRSPAKRPSRQTERRGIGAGPKGGEACPVTRVLMLAVALLLALAPWATPPTVRYLDAHVDVPYLRDCHGLFTHTDECVAVTGGRS